MEWRLGLGNRRTSRRRAAVVVTIATAAVGLATYASGSSAASSSAGARASAVSLATFQARLKAAEAPVTKWQGPTQPVTPPKHFKLAIVTCFSILHGCVSPATGAADAAKALGWTSTIYDGKDDPTVQAKDIEQAVTSHANAIITTAVNGSEVASALADAKAHHIPVISTSNGSAAGQQGFAFDTSPNLTKLGADIADWFIVASHGKGPIVAYLDKEFQSNIATEDGLQAELKLCTTCVVEPTVDFVATDVSNALGPNTVAYFQQNPSVKFFYGSYDPALTVQVPALQQAGLTSIQGSSILGDAQNLAYIRSGAIQASDGAWDNEYEGWATVDQIIRVVDHKRPFVTKGVPAPFKYGENIPYTLLVKSNLPPAGQDWHASFNYIAKFKKLWGLK